ncbi:uncharacterized protein LOC131029913 isoform X1 [Cryptomeria japonica]|uniref:uncharacterized protein LOC131029913 isoform X1 n=1 Tax=Cryptomeria japonica TaxID=3369 RepID=UPI0027DA100A|nr:uncharacterized protein LOC131029913 isoform X1 [Cryptomeria japonica]XP_059074428.1 uncharacterized protein LOC131029913 isoform X1 [Cryptomeria japonica]
MASEGTVALSMADWQVCETPRTPENEHAGVANGIGSPESLDYSLPVAAENYSPGKEVATYSAVKASAKGEGWPYAPEGWPMAGDKWSWKVGKRWSPKGYWLDRYLILPKRLQKGGRRVYFFSKRAVVEYINTEFPGTDIEGFFSSFQWEVPCITEGKTTACGKRGREPELGGNVVSEERVCKAGNPKCGIETHKNKSLKAMNCDICCIEFGFCRECSCILCGKTTDQSEGEYTSIRCEGKLNEEFVCGHVAHLECALLCHMAGVERSIGLDVEYYCRRCDKKTDLMMHIVGLLRASGCLKIRADVEKNLSIALRILQGTRKTARRSLHNVINSAVQKLHSGMNLEDIVELHQAPVAVEAGKTAIESEKLNYQLKPLSITPVSLVSPRGEAVQHSGCISSVIVEDNRSSASAFRNIFGARSPLSEPLQLAGPIFDEATSQKSSLVRERLRGRSMVLPEDANGAADLLSSPVHITALKFENRINQALHGLRRSQEAEYKLAQERLYAQKDFLLSLFKQLDMANSKFTNCSSSSSLENFDDLLDGVSDQVARLRKENAKFGQMLTITNGFGHTQKDILRDFFGVSLEDGRLNL